MKRKSTMLTIAVADGVRPFLVQVFDMIDADKAGRGRAGLYGMIRECKWAIVALAAIVCGMLAFRPELAGLIGTLAGN